MVLLDSFDAAAARADAAVIFPGRTELSDGDLEFAAYCRSVVQAGKATVTEAMQPLSFLQKKHDGKSWIRTLEIFLLDADRSIQKTTDALRLHRNTVKYRIKCMSERVGFPIGQMPASLSLYIAVGVSRLIG